MTSDASDYDRLIRPIEDRMIRTVWRIVQNADDADDALQRALEKIWRNLEKKIQRHPNPHALILRICVNAAHDVLRHKVRCRRREEIRPISDEVADRAATPAERLLLREARAEILAAIARLPRNQAQAILMRSVEELPYSDIAQALGCGEATARTHVRRGRARLAKLLPHLVPEKSKEVAT